MDSMRVAMNSLDGITKVDINFLSDFLAGVGGLSSVAAKATSKKQDCFKDSFIQPYF